MCMYVHPADIDSTFFEFIPYNFKRNGKKIVDKYSQYGIERFQMHPKRRDISRHTRVQQWDITFNYKVQPESWLSGSGYPKDEGSTVLHSTVWVHRIKRPEGEGKGMQMQSIAKRVSRRTGPLENEDTPSSYIHILNKHPNFHMRSNIVLNNFR